MFRRSVVWRQNARVTNARARAFTLLNLLPSYKSPKIMVFWKRTLIRPPTVKRIKTCESRIFSKKILATKTKRYGIKLKDLCLTILGSSVSILDWKHGTGNTGHPITAISAEKLFQEIVENSLGR